MKKVISFAALTALVAQSAFASTPAEDVGNQLKRLRGTKASFCFAVENGAVTGYNENTPVRSASVTKTLTTFWALKAKGANYQYQTHVYVQPQNKEVHISGVRDPFFDRDRLYLLLADLNRKGIKEISRLTFDGNFWFWPGANDWRYAGTKKLRGMKFSPRESFFLGEDHTHATIAGNPAQIKSGLTTLMSTANWSAQQKQRYAKAKQLNASAALPPSVQMKTDVVDQVPGNPLAGKPGVYDFVLKSAPLRTYLKVMNIYSINSYAEELFDSLGGKARYEADMSTLGYGQQLSNINSGSGVNLSANPKNRGDTTVSCSTVVRIIRTMDAMLEAQHLDLSDVMAVPGVEGGTWGDPSKTLTVKTGTLKRPTPTKNLAGDFNTTQGEVYFGIFIDGSYGKSPAVRNAQSAMMRHFRGVPLNYRAIPYTPLTGDQHMQLITNQPQPRAQQPKPAQAAKPPPPVPAPALQYAPFIFSL